VSPQAPRASMLQVFKAVLWSFFGIRKGAAHKADTLRLHPAQVVVAGLIAAALFIAILVLVVHFVIRHATA
jgi:hypothetical protein